MKLSTQLQYGDEPVGQIQAVVEWEKAGLDVVWVAEAYGFDAVSADGLPRGAHRAAARSARDPADLHAAPPRCWRMTAAGLDALSGGRAILGLGASGPQVIEGFHGVPYDRPIARTREIIEICRKVWRRERLEHDGIYTAPAAARAGHRAGQAAQDDQPPARGPTSRSGWPRWARRTSR